jgi:hypothetical protein
VKRLPIVGSSARATAFCSAKIAGPAGTYLYADGNQKICRENGTFEAPAPNAFSLVQVVTCPGSTEACRSACYVHNLETAQGAVHDLYKHNTHMINAILRYPEIADEWVMIMAAWIKANARGGFRWHVSGDVFSLQYARWIADVVRESAPVPHWIYTRSFAFLEPLSAVATVHGGNLSLNLSADRDNLEKAILASEQWGSRDQHLRLCYLTLDGAIPSVLGGDDVIFPDYKLRPRQHATLAESEWWASLTPAQRAMVCPVDAHGKSEKNRCGPCSRCLT